MRDNFLVSINRKAWIPGSKRLFIVEPYVYYAMKKDDELEKYEEIEIAPPFWQSKNYLKQAHDFVDKKYHKYIPLLAARLNSIHNKNYDNFFWKKCFSLGLLRYLTYTYEIFQLSEIYFRPEKHDCRILSEKSFSIPKDLNDQRKLFESTAHGQEQLFSIYVSLFYPARFTTFDDQFDWNWNKSSKVKSIIGRLTSITPANFRAELLRLFNKLKQYNVLKSFSKPNIGIMGTSISYKYIDELINRSKGRICFIPLKRDFHFTSDINWDKRKTLSFVESDFDKFDHFFFTSLKYCLSKEFVEDFQQIESHYENYFKKYRNLKHIVSEFWLGDTYNAVALAILQSHGIKHIYNEHHFLSHHYLGTNIKYIFPLVDSFITLGWNDKRIHKLIRGGSLYKWAEYKTQEKEYDILFIDGAPVSKVSEFNAAYGACGAGGAQRYLEFNKRFFMSLSHPTLKKIVFRPHPFYRDPVSSIKPPMYVYDYDDIVFQHLRHIKKFDNTSRNSKLLIAKSKLVIVNYLGTCYMEAMMADVPMIFFWNKENHPLNEEYLDFYDSLISAGICQTDPVQAAHFVEQIMDNPEDWWHSESVRKSREIFLSTNMGSPKLMLDYLLKLAEA